MQGNGEGKQKTGNKRRTAGLFFWGILLLILILNIAAWRSSSFCDWYIGRVFPIWVNTLGRLTGAFPFSVGECLIVLGLLLVAAAVLLGILWPAVTLLRADRRIFRRICRSFYRFFIRALLIVGLVMTLNCFILYHASTFSEHYFGGDDGEYTAEELLCVYNRVAAECNRLAELIERNAEGTAVYVAPDGSMISERDGEGWQEGLTAMADEARSLMRQLGEDYPQLAGWYPRPKALHFSDFMCQQYMQGYYFPFSMEANYNDVMHILNIPSTMCHELAHLRGYIYEDEANLIGYLACIRSEDPFFQYAGNLSVLTYLYNDVYRLYREYPALYEETVAKLPPVSVSAQVWEDNIFVSEKEWERIDREALFATETVNETVEVLVDTSLKINGVTDGKMSYGRVVRLLLQYYGQE